MDVVSGVLSPPGRAPILGWMGERSSREIRI